jgi:hypothetical protein
MVCGATRPWGVEHGCDIHYNHHANFWNKSYVRLVIIAKIKSEAMNWVMLDGKPIRFNIGTAIHCVSLFLALLCS